MPVLTKDQVLEAVYELDAEERAEVLARLSSEQSLPSLSLEQERELDEALGEHERNPNATRSWDAVHALLRAKR